MLVAHVVESVRDSLQARNTCETQQMFSLLTGISIYGLEDPLTVGQSATISCMTNISVTSIEWRDQSSQLIMSTAVNLTALEYTIPLVTDDLQGQQFTCIALAGPATYAVEVQVQGMSVLVNGM